MHTYIYTCVCVLVRARARVRMGAGREGDLHVGTDVGGEQMEDTRDVIRASLVPYALLLPLHMSPALWTAHAAGRAR